jgi:hypothetical protein
MMKVEVFYFEGCPNRQPAVERVKEILKKEGLDVEVVEIEVPDHASAQAVGFLGSPTIRIDGLDVEASARSSQAYGMMCRTYLEAGQRDGIPSRDRIRVSMREAISRLESGAGT